MSKQPNVDLSNVTAEHSFGKGVVVKRKRGRPKKQTEPSSGGSEGDVLTLQELLTEGVGWFTIKPAVTIVALVRRRYSYHRCVDCSKKGVQNTERKYCCVDHPEAETE